MRVIPVTLVTDPGFREVPQWRGLAQRCLDEAAKEWPDSARVAFRIRESLEWKEPAQGPLVQVLNQLTGLGSEGITAAFVGPRESWAGEDHQGYGSLGRPYLVVAADDPRTMVTTLRHELGHVFGLPHLPGRQVMAEATSFRSGEFDRLSLYVLQATSTMDLRADTPFQDCDLDILRDVYLIWAGEGIGQASLLHNLGVALRREDRDADAEAVFRAALDRNNDYAPSWFHLGRVLDTVDHHDEALNAYRQYLVLDPAGRNADQARAALK